MLPDPRPYFAELTDPRRETKNKLHKLSDIVMTVLCAVLSGIEDWVGMEAFAEEKEGWLRGLSRLPNGIPSHDTLSDVFGRIDRQAFAEAFTRLCASGLAEFIGRTGLSGRQAALWESQGGRCGASDERICGKSPVCASPTGGRGQVE